MADTGRSGRGRERRGRLYPMGAVFAVHFPPRGGHEPGRKREQKAGL